MSIVGGVVALSAMNFLAGHLFMKEGLLIPLVSFVVIWIYYICYRNLERLQHASNKL